jgi:hypothetical protein
MIGDRKWAEVMRCERRLPKGRSDGNEASEPPRSAQGVERGENKERATKQLLAIVQSVRQEEYK